MDGAAVNVSMVGFDNGTETKRFLDNQRVSSINADLTGFANIVHAKSLKENEKICFRADEKGGPFDIDAKLAEEMLLSSNQSGLPNSDVVRPYLNARDVVQSPSNTWIIDFGYGTSLHEAEQYEKPFEHVKKVVKPIRDNSNNQREKDYWWLHRRPAPDMRAAVNNLRRFIITPALAKHRLFLWVESRTIPDHAVYIFARQDDYFFGVLQSVTHELWALKKGTSLEDRPRYTPTSTFETFPFPWPPGEEPKQTSEVFETSEVYLVEAIAANAKALDDFRTGWLNSIEGEVGVTITEKTARRYTLTNLYNALAQYREEYRGKQRDPRLWAGSKYGDIISLEQVETLDHIHARLDQSVLDAYGWPHNLSDEGILERLLALNLERSGNLK